MRHLMPFKWWDKLGVILLNLFVLGVVGAYLLPLAFMVVTALQSHEQLTDRDAPIMPSKRLMALVEDEDGELDERIMYKAGNESRQLWVLIDKGRNRSIVAEVNRQGDVIGDPFEWEGRWRTLVAVYEPSLNIDKFTDLQLGSSFWTLVKNTMRIVIPSAIGVMIASVLVAYGFARYPLPGGKFLFLVLIGTIILPEKITLVPTYFTFIRVFGWFASIKPLIVPHLFGNAILIFLLRQNFMAISHEMEQAAMVDGAGPLRILWSIILPQTIPTLVTVLLLHFFFVWNETRMSVLYLSAGQDIRTLSMAVSRGFGTSIGQQQAQALVSMAIPVIILLLAQPIFMRGVKVTGAE